MLLLALVALGTVMAVLAAGLATRGIVDGSLDGVTGMLKGDTGALLFPLAIAFGALGAVTLFALSIVVGVSTHNAPALGAEPSALPPRRALGVWLDVLWAQARIAAALLVPVWLFSIGWGIFGGAFALLCLERLQHNIDDIDGWLRRPARHVADLYEKFALKGASSRLASAWKVGFVAANVLTICAWAVPAGVLAGSQIGPMARKANLPLASSDALLVVTRSVAIFVLWGAAIATLIAIALLAPLVVGLVRRQQTRRVLVLAGLSRPWMQGGPLLGAPGQTPPGPLGQDALAAVSGDGFDTYQTVAVAERPDAGVPRWRQHEAGASGPMSFGEWLDRLKTDQIREEQQRAADEAASAELIAQAERERANPRPTETAEPAGEPRAPELGSMSEV